MQKISTRQWTMPTRLTLKINFGALQLFIVQWRPSEQQWKGKPSQWKRLLHIRRTHTGPLLFFAIFMVQILDFGMGYLKNCLIH